MELGRDLNQAELDLVHYPRVCAVCGCGANQVGGEVQMYCAVCFKNVQNEWEYNVLRKESIE